MDIREALNKTIELVQNELLILFEANGMKREQLGSFGKLFYNEFDNYLTNAGKRIRPFLTITAFNAVNGDHSTGNIVRASLAIELLHNGSLLHDDVIDKDETRRGKPAFHIIFRDIYLDKKNDTLNNAVNFGEAMSIFAGDLCFPYAIESIIQSGFPGDLKVRALQSFTQAFREVIDGVILETGNNILHKSSETTYKLMVSLKTGALIRKAIEIGAILGNGTLSQIDALVAYCSGIGSSFQIQDDILGIYGNPEELGKPVGGDIRENKWTILRIYAMENGSDKQVKRIQELMGKQDISNKEIEEIQKIFKETGALNYAMQLIETSTEKAIKALDTAQPPLKEEPKKLLIALAKYLVARKK